MNSLLRIAGLLSVLALLHACYVITEEIQLNKTVQLSTYERLGVIEKTPFAIGLVATDHLQDSIASVTLQGGTETTETSILQDIRYEMDVGETLVARLVQVLALQFDRVQLFTNGAPESLEYLDYILIVDIEDLNASIDVKIKFFKAEAQGFSNIEIRGTLKNKNEQLLWSGTGRGQYQEAKEGTNVNPIQIAEKVMNTAIAEAIANLLEQIHESGAIGNSNDDEERLHRSLNMRR